MQSLSVDFHALPAELLEFLQQLVVDFGVHIVALRYRPFDAHEVAENQLDSYFSSNSTFRRFHASLTNPILPVSDELDFGDKNPDSLRLDVGSFGEDGLTESWLSARTNKTHEFAVWKKIAGRLKRMTTGGATAFNPDTGTSGPAKSHRFTEGALKLASTGIPLRTTTGIYMLPSQDTGK